MKKITRHPLFVAVMVHVAAVYSKLIYATVRVQVVGPIPQALSQGPVLLACWHQQISALPAISRYTPHQVLALMSASRDGSAIASIARWHGITSATGSSHRGALSGTRELLRAAKSGKTLFITPDGPRGPAHVAKQGATEVSKMTNFPLIPCAGWCTRGAFFNSWDKFLLPHLFSTIVITFAEPLADTSPAALQQALNTLTAQAQAASASLATPSATT